METTKVMKMVSSSMPMVGEGGESLPAEKKGEEKRRVLPADLQREILSRTPASSLVRFRPACKMWYELTYDPAFIDLHVERARLRKISGTGTPHLLCFYQRPLGFCRRFSITMLDESMTPIADITAGGIDDRRYGLYAREWPRAPLFMYYHMTPPCNGWVCVYDAQGDATLINPMTGERLHLHPGSEPVERYYRLHKCFLGYHPVTKEYKVLRFLVSGKGSTAEAFYEAVTLGTGIGILRRTRIYDGEKNFTSCDGDGISVNGVVYILNETDRKMGLFDLKDEKFSPAIPFHDSISVDQGQQPKLVEVEGNICLVSIPRDVLDIWMLKDAAGRASWIHRCRVALHHQFIDQQIAPVLIHQGELLVGWKSNLYYLGLSSDKESTRKVTNHEPLRPRRIFHAYEGSLVSLIRR